MIVKVILQEMECYLCTTHFAMDKSLYWCRREDGNTFWCPNGHGQCFRESVVDKLKKENQLLKNRALFTKTHKKIAKKFDQPRDSRGHFVKSK